ncbi:NAD-dependent epimerase/dehydratase [Herbaspirillum sp. GW103]|jgi:dTDP-glucose 4,6-dehydratase|uniref:GDP-mannose 4,6-dehydratase n=1 Tax=Herbaspirillum sp. GW103 TaxID=1175306 RepID=UPI00025E2A82|nr:GDP-mannose 4,6-dehydratase [Herbaspirillum sp. GW103]EIJ48585.1 NAD-dependent epimerase/dehydratase [Herbaspirillum sp. GW103]
MTFERIAVLGSNSFAGSVFVARALADGAEVVGFNRSAEGSAIFLPVKKSAHQDRYTFHQADINHDLEKILAVLEQFKPTLIVDFAGQGMVAESWHDPVQWYNTNILAKVRLHERLRRYDWLERYIRISTPEVYGSQESTITESLHYLPSTPYAVSHAAIDMSLRAFHQNYAFPVIFTRYANFYGPGQQLYRIVPRTIIYALTGKTLQLHGGGTAVRAFIAADDVADGIMRAASQGNPGEIYHFSPERFMSIRQVVEIICERVGVVFGDLVEMVPDRAGKDQAYLMDATKARTVLGWHEGVSFEQGIDQTIAWVRDNLDEIKRLPLNYLHKD